MTFVKVCLVLSLVLMGGGVSLSAQAMHKGKPHAMEEPSKEMRAKMATLHEDMAACLKSDKSFADCHKAMMDNCPMAKEGKCPMMPHGHMMKKGAAEGEEHAH